jgi:cellulose synthase/poly-beta-1,6-N-acetylglucosamine synthase-like glycosyltransferase
MFTGLLLITGALCLYSYFLYPLLLLLLRLFRRQEFRRGDFEPRISIIIAAYNEESKILGKLENTLAVDYPREKLELIVASDASSDGTDEIVRNHPGGFILSRVESRKGKEYAQKMAIQKATGDVLVFTDAGTTLKQDSIRRLAGNFFDERVGAVSSTDKMVSENDTVVGEGLYVVFEMGLRRLEYQVNSLVGLSGSFFAARKEVCRNWSEDLQSDFNTVLNSVKQGYKAIADDEVIGYYKNISKGQSEFKRKVRTMVRGMTVFFRATEMLNVFKYGLFSWQLLSHKFMRWATPFFLLALLAVSITGAALGHGLSQIALALQGAFYGISLLGFAVPALQGMALFKIPFFFVEMNVAVMAAWIKYLRGERIKVWEPSRR